MKKLIQSIFFISTILIAPHFIYAEDLNIDTDIDGLSDKDEMNTYFTDPNNSDTDGDGYKDGEEIKNKYSPREKNKKLINIDSDKDGLNDLFELALGTNLLNPDTDEDGYKDGQEISKSYNPLSKDKQKITKSIKVTLKTQYLGYYFGDKLLTEFKISSGIKSLPTPKGQFKILEKIPTKLYKGSNYYYPNTKWNLRVTRSGILIHGAYWHNNFGKPMSHGCINVSYENIEPLYNFTDIGTKVIIE